MQQYQNHDHTTHQSENIAGNLKKTLKNKKLPYVALYKQTLPHLQNNDFFQKTIKSSKMVQIQRENIPEKAQTFRFPKLIELLLYDQYFLKRTKICLLEGLIHAHHGTFKSLSSVM